MVSTDVERGLILVEGAVPGSKGGWISVRDAGKIMIYDTHSFEKLREIDADSPSGIFFTARAHRTGL